MYFTVIFNGVHYGSEVNLQIALDYIEFRKKQSEKANLSWYAALVSAETGELVYEKHSEI